jgi:S-adenosylmethionine decarboxylase
MMLKAFDLDQYLFAATAAELAPAEVKDITARVSHEMQEIFYGRNLPEAP